MAIFEIYSIEINAKREIEAPDIKDAMFAYLPWPTLDISIAQTEVEGQSLVVDNRTKFHYKVKLLFNA
jgi:hypothetical protein|tara:strand:+ start:13616 stop:13819 length:204 start_codon:yes stop_codon:yes gene_type:complete